MFGREFLVKIYKDTKNKCLNGTYGRLTYEKSSTYSSSDSRFKKFEDKNKFEKTTIEVINSDVLEIAQMLSSLSYAEIGSKILVLNLASNSQPGGGVKRGAIAQEEELFRRTNYFMSLTEGFYPLKKTNVIYTPNVLVVKDKNYNDLKTTFYVSMLAAAAIRRPELTKDNTYKDHDYTIMLQTVENIFRHAYSLGYTTLVLGALGCGAYGNPASEVIKIFNTCLLKYGEYFKRITFAVLSKGTSNYSLFDKGIVRHLK
jgi:uncharacterized protein (TIGR02452 family)